jgi:hypothetical protein
MSRSANTESVAANPQSARAAVWLAAGIVAGIAFTGYILKPAPVAQAAPAAIDYKAITEAVRAGFPAPAPVAAPVAKAAPAPVASPAPARAKRKVHRAASPARVVYYVPAYHGCTCHL